MLFKKRLALFFHVFLLTLLLPYSPVAAKTTAKALAFDALTINDGLSQGMVNAILQDRYGFMWFASNDGLNRYDGNKFTIYKNDPNDNNSLAENFIRYLFEDSAGRIWIATAGSGLDLFDRTTETFIHFKNSAKDLNTISDNSITSISEDAAGGIWIGTLHGLNRLVIRNKKEIKPETPQASATENFLREHTVSFSKIIFDPTNPDREIYSWADGFPLANWRASNFYIDNQGMVWVSAQGKLYRLKPLRNAGYKLENLPVEAYMPPSQKRKGFEKSVQNFIPGATCNVFYMLFQNGITEVNSLTGKVQFLSETPLNKGAFSFPSVLDNAGNIWTSDENITGWFNTVSNTWQKISSADKNMEPVLGYIACSYKDKRGNIWLGTKGYGVLKYNPETNNFNKTENEYIRFMTAGKDEKILFIKNPYDELFWEFDRRTNITQVPVPMSALAKKQFTHFGTNTKSVLQDKDGSYWIGRIGLYHYNPVTKKAVEYWDHYDDVFPLYDDDRNNLWFGNTNGIVQFDKSSKTSKEYTFPAKTTMGPYDYLQAIHRDKKGILWLGTLAGLYRFDPEKETWKQYKNIAGDLNSLNNNLIFSICPDQVQPDKYLWIGTKGGGLNLFDQTTGTFRHFTEKQGLSNDVVYGILSDASGNLWLSTNKGISQFNTRTKEFKNYNEDDGLQGSEFNRNAFCKTSKGYLYFGGITGFNYFNPAKLSARNYVPFVWITGINVLNQPLQFSEQNGILNKPAYLTERIQLHYEQNVISFVFASTDFSAFDNNRFKYQLTGFDKTWINSGNSNNATYTNLNPGTYTFRVKGSNNDGTWNEKAASIQLIILPPWYMTWWFRTGLVLAMVLAGYTFYRYRLAQALKLQAIRDRIASDLHDEVGSNLSNIYIFSNVAQQKAKSNDETAPLLLKITDYTQQSMEAMNDIVWMINTRNDRFENIMARMRTLAAEFSESSDCKLHLDLDEKLNHIKLDMEARKNFYLIYKEAINNTAKYAVCKSLWIEMKLQQNTVTLIIRDNGKGFDLANTNNGNGMFNMKKRAEMLKGVLTIVSKVGKGTTLELSFKV
ncbi:MAG: ligand-binding sensor domain-containing protein [Adhaeribacter sp.]